MLFKTPDVHASSHLIEANTNHGVFDAEAYINLFNATYKASGEAMPTPPQSSVYLFYGWSRIKQKSTFLVSRKSGGRVETFYLEEMLQVSNVEKIVAQIGFSDNPLYRYSLVVSEALYRAHTFMKEFNKSKKSITSLNKVVRESVTGWEEINDELWEIARTGVLYVPVLNGVEPVYQIGNMSSLSFVGKVGNLLEHHFEDVSLGLYGVGDNRGDFNLFYSEFEAVRAADVYRHTDLLMYKDLHVNISVLASYLNTSIDEVRKTLHTFLEKTPARYLSTFVEALHFVPVKEA